MLVARWCASPAACTTGVSKGSMLPDLLVDVRVENPRLGAQVRLEREHLVLADEFLDRVVLDRVLQVAEDARLGGADLDAGRPEAARDAVVAQRALLRRLGLRVQEPASVGAGLDAEPAADAVGGVHQHRAVGAVKRGPNRARLRAGRMLAEVAELRDEERIHVKS